MPSSQGLSGGGHGHGRRGDGNKKASGGGRALHTTAMAPCYYAGTRQNLQNGADARIIKTGPTDSDAEAMPARERMTRTSVAGGKRRRMATGGTSMAPSGNCESHIWRRWSLPVSEPPFDCLFLSTPADRRGASLWWWWWSGSRHTGRL